MSTKWGDAVCDGCGRIRLKGDWPFCDDGTGLHGHERSRGGNLIQSIHRSERAVIFRHPLTGEVRTPPKADAAMPTQYAAAGFERVEIANHQMRRDLEKEGHFQEAAYYDNGSATADRELERSIGPALDGSCIGDGGKERLTLKDLQDAGLQD